jgi:hypothetical protein
MRAPTTVLTAGLSAAAAVVLLAACGGSVEGTDVPAAASSGSSSAAPGSSGAGAPAGDAAAWCDQALALSSDLQHALTTAGSDQVAPVLQQAAATYADVQAPAGIAQDWELVVGAVQTLATAAQSIDFTAPDAGDQLVASISGQEDALNTAMSHVQSYAQANCAGAGATPTS